MSLHHVVRGAALATALWAPVLSTRAQELLGVDGQGTVVAINLASRTTRTVVTTTMGGCHAMSRKVRTVLDPNGPRFYAAAAAGNGCHLFSIDPLTGTPTLAFASVPGPIVALADEANTPFLWAIVDAPVDRLARFDVVAGALTILGPTGFSSLRGLQSQQGRLYAFDASVGLVQLDKATGVGVDVNPQVDAQGCKVQFLASDETGQVLAGADELFSVDVANGVLTPLGVLGMADVRGADLRNGLTVAFGLPCAMPSLSGSFLFVHGPLVVDSTMSFVSHSHTPGAPALVGLGLPSSTHAGAPLPIDLDPLLGTNGCSLHISPVVAFPGVAAAFGRVTIQVQLLQIPGAELHAQMFVLENVPGGLDASDARRIRIPR